MGGRNPPLPVASRQQVRERPGALLRCIIRKGPRSGVASGRGVPAVSTVTTSPLAACCATNVPRDVRLAGASTSPAATAEPEP